MDWPKEGGDTVTRIIRLRMQWLSVLLLVACSGGGEGTDHAGDAAGMDLPDVENPADAVEAGPDYAGIDFPVCVPGTPATCTDDGMDLVVCNGDGSGYEIRPCGDGICRPEPLGCTTCLPGRKKCQDEDVVLRCNQEGDAFEAFENCDPGETGKICQIGICVSLCELTEKLQSYIGCEYWGVDLDNAFVPGSGEGGFHDAAGAQYAIVVSNTSTKYPARVEIHNALGRVTHDSQCNPFPDDPIPPMGLRIFNIPRKYPVKKGLPLEGSDCEVCATRPGDASYPGNQHPGKACIEDPDTRIQLWDADLTVQAPFAYRVKASLPITAYQFNPLENVGVFSNDATILLPTNALGKYYLAMTREQTFSDLKGFITVAAVNPGETQVVVTVTAPTLPGTGSIPIPRMVPGETRTFTLKQYDILNIETDFPGADLTGSVVLASNPVAVFGGSEAANAPNTARCCPNGSCDYHHQWLECNDRNDCLCEWPRKFGPQPMDVPCRKTTDCLRYNTCCADHLEMQMFPVKTWGREYVATHSYPRGGEKDIWRLMAAENGTILTTYRPQFDKMVLNRGEFIDFESGEHFTIHAQKPVMVGQFLAAQDAPDPNIGSRGPDDANTGDPTFILAVPVEQFRTEYVFLAPDKYLFDCVNIIVPHGEPVLLDGKELRAEDLTFRPIRDIQAAMKAPDKQYTDPSQLGIRFGDYSVIGKGDWGVWRLVITDGVHTARSAKPFGVISYGYDQYVSYGYPAGMNLEDLKLVGEDP
jgi:hypothetical protein